MSTYTRPAQLFTTATTRKLFSTTDPNENSQKYFKDFELLIQEKKAKNNN
jgi:hypothetical protein